MAIPPHPFGWGLLAIQKMNKTDEQLKEDIINWITSYNKDTNTYKVLLGKFTNIWNFVKSARQGYISKEEHEKMVLAINRKVDEYEMELCNCGATKIDYHNIKCKFQKLKKSIGGKLLKKKKKD